MKDERLEGGPGPGGGQGGDDETGRPVSLLAELRVEPSRSFLGRVRRGIDRRLLGGQALDLTWSGPLSVLLEYLKMLFQLIRRDGDDQGEERWKPPPSSGTS